MLYPSARNSRFHLSVIAKRRNRDASRLKNPGPSVVNRPRLPNWPGAGAEKFEVSNQGAVLMPCSTLTGPLMLGELLRVPGVLSGPGLAVKLIGEPLITVRTPETCHPPRSHDPTPCCICG